MVNAYNVCEKVQIFFFFSFVTNIKAYILLWIINKQKEKQFLISLTPFCNW